MKKIRVVFFLFISTTIVQAQTYTEINEGGIWSRGGRSPLEKQARRCR